MRAIRERASERDELVRACERTGRLDPKEDSSVMERRGDDTRPRYVVEVCIGWDSGREGEPEPAC